MGILEGIVPEAFDQFIPSFTVFLEKGDVKGGITIDVAGSRIHSGLIQGCDDAGFTAPGCTVQGSIVIVVGGVDVNPAFNQYPDGIRTVIIPDRPMQQIAEGHLGLPGKIQAIIDHRLKDVRLATGLVKGGITASQILWKGIGPGLHQHGHQFRLVFTGCNLQGIAPLFVRIGSIHIHAGFNQHLQDFLVMAIPPDGLVECIAWYPGSGIKENPDDFRIRSVADSIFQG